MNETFAVKYEVIGRALVADKSSLQRHSLNLLYRGDGTPWWTCSAGLQLPIPADLEIAPGDMVTLTIAKVSA